MNGLTIVSSSHLLVLWVVVCRHCSSREVYVLCVCVSQSPLENPSVLKLRLITPRERGRVHSYLRFTSWTRRWGGPFSFCRRDKIPSSR